jgi:hypothetical protein
MTEGIDAKNSVISNWNNAVDRHEINDASVNAIVKAAIMRGGITKLELFEARRIAGLIKSSADRLDEMPLGNVLVKDVDRVLADRAEMKIAAREAQALVAAMEKAAPDHPSTESFGESVWAVVKYMFNATVHSPIGVLGQIQM